MKTAVLIEHICLDKRGRALIAGTTMKVEQVVLEKVAWGMSPEQIQEQHPCLSLAQIHAALSYYYDHKAECDAEIEKQAKRTDVLRAELGETSLGKRAQERKSR